MYRLPTDIIPNSYELRIKAYVGDESIYGGKSFTQESSTKINFTCANLTTKVLLHAHDLNITSISVSSEFDKDNGVDGNWTYDEVTQFLGVNLKKECQVSTDYAIEIYYTGSINEDLDGFYKSTYVDLSGKKR